MDDLWCAVATSADGTIPAAFRLGWLVGHLYNDVRHLSAHPSGDPPLPLPARLADPSTLPGNGYALLQLAQIKRERESLVAAGLALTDTSELQTALAAKDKTGAQRRGDLYTLDVTWLRELAEQRFATTRAYQLGRSLQATTHAEMTADSLADLFNRARISELSSWLDDLEPNLATDNLFAVKSSLHSWTRWAEQQQSSQEGGQQDTPLERPTGAQLRGALYRQGTIWFSLLGSGTDPSTYVIAENYVDAAKNLLHVVAELVRALGWRWWLAVAAVAVAVVGVVAFASTTLNGGSQAATIIAAILAGAGISWKAVGATVGATAKRLEQPLWQAEQRLALAAATTRLPSHATVSGRPPTIHR